MNFSFLKVCLIFSAFLVTSALFYLFFENSENIVETIQYVLSFGGYYWISLSISFLALCSAIAVKRSFANVEQNKNLSTKQEYGYYTILFLVWLFFVIIFLITLIETNNTEHIIFLATKYVNMIVFMSSFVFIIHLLAIAAGFINFINRKNNERISRNNSNGKDEETNNA